MQHMTTDQTPTDEAPHTDRERAELLFDVVCQDVDKLDNHATAEDLAARTLGERQAETQLTALQAIYYEMRHGNDQLAHQATALEGHAAAMDNLRSTLMSHTDALERFRRSL